MGLESQERNLGRQRSPGNFYYLGTPLPGLLFPNCKMRIMPRCDGQCLLYSSSVDKLDLFFFDKKKLHKDQKRLAVVKMLPELNISRVEGKDLTCEDALNQEKMIYVINFMVIVLDLVSPVYNALGSEDS